MDADPVRTPPWYRDDAEIVLATSLAHGLEGVVGKPLTSRYHPGRRRDWIKVKNVRHQEVVICGWIQGSGGRANTMGSLLLGVYDKGPQISVEDAMAELNAMSGLAPVKEQVRSIAASIEAARRRAVAGIITERPMRHFVFLGPPGTGKTTVARVMAKIFYAFGLLQMPEVIEAHGADLVGEFPGATAIKTNELVDSALGGVLFMDEAYGLVNGGDGQADRFGQEAVQTLLKRAEDDRESLIIVLAGYEKQMESFLASNPGLASRFATRLKFPSYSPTDMIALAVAALDRRGEVLDPDARPVLWRTLEEVGRRRMADDLGNGRFVRSLLEKAGQARDVRVMTGMAEPAAKDLVTIRSGDLERAYAELTSRLRGYEDTPTVEGAIAELDELIGLEPLKQQMRAIAAQLRVAKLRDTHGLTSRPLRGTSSSWGRRAPARLWSRRFSGASLRPLACFSAPRWYGLSAPTSSASILA